MRPDKNNRLQHFNPHWWQILSTYTYPFIPERSTNPGGVTDLAGGHWPERGHVLVSRDWVVWVGCVTGLCDWLSSDRLTDWLSSITLRQSFLVIDPSRNVIMHIIIIIILISFINILLKWEWGVNGSIVWSILYIYYNSDSMEILIYIIILFNALCNKINEINGLLTRLQFTCASIYYYQFWCRLPIGVLFILHFCKRSPVLSIQIV